MRILMILTLSFCAGLGLSLILPGSSLLSITAVIMLLSAVLLMIVFRRRELRLILILLGLAPGLLLGHHFHRNTVLPAQQYADKNITLTAEAASYPTETAYGLSLEARMITETGHISLIMYLDSEIELKPGDMITGDFRIKDSNTDGSFYNYSEGIFLKAYENGETTILSCDRVPLRYLPKKIAHDLELCLMRSFPEDTLGFALALTTGNRSYLSDVTKANLKATGIYHALTLSGMHLAVLVSIINLMVMKHKRLKAILGIPLGILFTIVTGCAASMVRAAVMETLYLSAFLFLREKDAPTSLSLALAILMAQNPWSIFSWGLQLSFLSVIGMELFAEKIQAWITGEKVIRHKLLRWLRKFFASSIASTFSAMVMTMPLMAVYFGYISLISPVTNLLTSTVISICFGGSLFSSLLGLVLPPVGAIGGWITAWGFRYVDRIVSLLSRVPFAQFSSRNLYGVILLLIIYAMIGILFIKGNKKRVIPISCMVSSIAVIALLIMLEGTAPSVTAIDVGQGQCILMESGETNIMVDCGGNAGDAGDIAVDYLSARGENSLDLLILTHYDEDHIGGVIQLLGRIPVKKLLLPDTEHEKRYAIAAAAQDAGTEVYFILEDITLRFSGGSAEVYGPLYQGESNESGLSINANLEGLKVLITGDMDQTSELRLLKEKNIPEVHVLVAGHHGAQTSTSQLLLETIKPEYVLIPVGQNRYGHPAEETIARIEASGAEIKRTDIHGNSTIKGD